MSRIADPKIAQQRQQEILQATMTCVIKHGFHAASMKEICKEAKMSSGGIYRYFSSKEDIILALAKEEQKENQEIITQLKNSQNLLLTLKGVITSIFQSYENADYSRFIIELMAEAGRNPQVLKIFQKNECILKKSLISALEKAQQKGDINSNNSANLQAEFILALLDGFSTRTLLDPNCSPQIHIKTVIGNLTVWLNPTV